MAAVCLTPLNVFIGWDSRETVAYHVLCHSLIRQASGPVSITPLVQAQLRQRRLYTRPVDDRASTEFSLTRFLVPLLAGYEGWALYLDCAMLMCGDVYELLDEAMMNPGRLVYCVQHDYKPQGTRKFLGQLQYYYPRKNWSSLMLFHTDYCRALTKKYVNTATPEELHRFKWLGENEIGKLPLRWNYLVGEPNQATGEPKNIHFTQGTPCFPDYAECEYADRWCAERDLAYSSVNVPMPEVSYSAL